MADTQYDDLEQIKNYCNRICQSTHDLFLKDKLLSECLNSDNRKVLLQFLQTLNNNGSDYLKSCITHSSDHVTQLAKQARVTLPNRSFRIEENLKTVKILTDYDLNLVNPMVDSDDIHAEPDKKAFKIWHKLSLFCYFSH